MDTTAEHVGRAGVSTAGTRTGTRTGTGTGTGLTLIVLGVVFLAMQATGWLSIGRLTGRYGWPLIVVAAGLLFYVGMFVGGRGAGALAVPGTVVVTAGVVLFVENLTGLWQTMAYAWALIVPTGVGFGLMVHGLWSHAPEASLRGRQTVAVGLAIFAVLCVFFELVLNLSGAFGGQVSRYVPALVLIAAGALMFIRRPDTIPAE